MRATRRRIRRIDPLASPTAVRVVCRRLQDRMPDVIPMQEKHLLRLLYSVRHVERCPASDTKRGRPSLLPREKLIEAANQLRSILARETSGRVSLNSFIGHYLPILLFPSDVTTALTEGHINLHEASQLARLSAERLDSLPTEARRTRQEVLKSHLIAQGSQNGLRSRVKELLGEAKADGVTSQAMTAVLAKADELLEVDPSDSRHIFWEEMKRIFFAMKEIQPEDLNEEVLGQLMEAVDELSNALNRVAQLRSRRLKKSGILIV